MFFFLVHVAFAGGAGCGVCGWGDQSGERFFLVSLVFCFFLPSFSLFGGGGGEGIPPPSFFPERLPFATVFEPLWEIFLGEKRGKGRGERNDSLARERRRGSEREREREREGRAQS